eukprot:gb/GECH01010925.1/.p1 GENE.gb/GECH01010925.1/~~gb/GECH01010925.1/.p1  ORF type:complete len:1084 (+),score=378.63 gb/GECH01010925.1/:1-3252(+)
MFDDDDFADDSQNDEDDSPYSNLPEGVRRLLQESGTNISDSDDLEALSVVSVQDLAKMWEELTQGVSLEESLSKMKDQLLRKARRKKTSKVKVQNTLKQQEDEKKRKEEEERRRKEEEEKAMHRKHEELEAWEKRLKKLEQELNDKQKELEKWAKELAELQEKLKSEKEDHDTMVNNTEQDLQQRTEKIEKKENELNERETSIEDVEKMLAEWEEKISKNDSELKEREEELQNQEEKAKEAQREREQELEKRLEEMDQEESARKEKINQLEQKEKELNESHQAEEERHREKLEQDRSEMMDQIRREQEEEQSEWRKQKEKEEENINSKKTEIEEQKQKLDQQQFEINESEKTFKEYEQSVKNALEDRERKLEKTIDQMKEREADLKHWDEKLEKERQHLEHDAYIELQRKKEEQDRREQDLNEKSANIQDRYESMDKKENGLNEREKELEEWEAEIRRKEKLFDEKLASGVSSNIRDEGMKKRNYDNNKIMMEQLDKAQFLKIRFQVSKWNPRRRAPGKDRIWEIDFCDCVVRNMKQTGEITKEFSFNRFHMERRISTGNVLRLRFGSGNPYDIKFNTGFERDRFYECCWTMRQKMYIWCPELCPDDMKRADNVDFLGTVTVRPGKISPHSIVPSTFAGKASLNVSRTPFEPISVFCGTWNMAELPVPSTNVLRRWIVPGYDVYAITIQESGFPKKSGDHSKDPFVLEMLRVLGQNYKLIISQELWGINIVLFVNSKHGRKIGNAESGFQGTGVLGGLGNKGATALSMKFNDTSMAFIGCHLAAGQDKVNERNNNLDQILQNLRLGIKELDILMQHHYVFIMGDLNYRLDMHSVDQALEKCEENDIRGMVKNDQLLNQIKSNLALSHFKEGKINFLPTYKYSPGTLNFDTSRIPSFTDRILYKTYPTLKIRVLEYGRCDDVLSSDHVPLYSIFRVNTQLPFGSVFSKNDGDLEICFPGGIRVCDMPAANSQKISKPILAFHGLFMEGATARSVPTSSSEGLKWTENDMPKIVITTPNLTYLKHQFLIVSLNDKKPLRGRDSLKGVSAIPLEKGCGDDAQPFNLALYTNGVKTARLEGNIFIKT